MRTSEPLERKFTMFDYHVHTSFSADSKMPMKVACETAIKNGVKEIAFTEHMDYFYPNCDLTFEFDYQEYASQVELMRSEFSKNLTILKAVEMGLHPSTFERSNHFISENHFDFVIGSAHIVDDLDLHNGDYFEGKSLERSLEIYFKTVNQYVKEYENFDVLGHLTLIKRYLHFVKSDWKTIKWENYFDIVEDTFKVLVQTNRGIEVNMSGYRYRIDCSLPNLPFVKLYREAGGEIITVGTDAHTKHFVGNQIDEGYELLKAAGFKYVTTYRERKPSFMAI